jgi:hypothetical protein
MRLACGTTSEVNCTSSTCVAHPTRLTAASDTNFSTRAVAFPILCTRLRNYGKKAYRGGRSYLSAAVRHCLFHEHREDYESMNQQLLIKAATIGTTLTLALLTSQGGWASQKGAKASQKGGLRALAERVAALEASSASSPSCTCFTDSQLRNLYHLNYPDGEVSESTDWLCNFDESDVRSFVLALPVPGDGLQSYLTLYETFGNAVPSSGPLGLCFFSPVQDDEDNEFARIKLLPADEFEACLSIARGWLDELGVPCVPLSPPPNNP